MAEEKKRITISTKKQARTMGEFLADLRSGDTAFISEMKSGSTYVEVIRPQKKKRLKKQRPTRFIGHVRSDGALRGVWCE